MQDSSGEAIKLGDCSCRQVNIGALHLNATDYGASIVLTEFLQRKLVSLEREARNRCTSIAVSDGIMSFPGL